MLWLELIEMYLDQIHTAHVGELTVFVVCLEHCDSAVYSAHIDRADQVREGSAYTAPSTCHMCLDPLELIYFEI